MQLTYHEDIEWQDLPKIERFVFAQGTVRNELTNPWPKICVSIFNGYLGEIYQNFHRNTGPNILKRLLNKEQSEGKVLFVHIFKCLMWVLIKLQDKADTAIHQDCLSPSYMYRKLG